MDPLSGRRRLALLGGLVLTLVLTAALWGLRLRGGGPLPEAPAPTPREEFLARPASPARPAGPGSRCGEWGSSAFIDRLIDRRLKG